MNKWYKLYWNIVDDNQLGIVGKAFNRLVRKYVKKRLDIDMSKAISENPIACGLYKGPSRKRKLVCSLTSFPARIDEIHISIETIFRQTVKADEIVLWLSNEQFPTHELPESLKLCIEHGLTVKWVDDDLRSHKKYFYALQEYSNADVVLLDDDLYYPDRLLENLVAMSKRHPNAICVTRVHKMKYSDGKLLPYKQWTHNYNPKKENTSKDYFFTSGFGTLIPPSIMPKQLFNAEVFKKICFYADDVWLNFMTRYAKIDIYTNNVYDKDPISIGKSQNVKLVSLNVINGGNDKQISAVTEYLKSEKN
jgi:hypothetical protein